MGHTPLLQRHRPCEHSAASKSVELGLIRLPELRTDDEWFQPQVDLVIVSSTPFAIWPDASIVLLLPFLGPRP